MRVSDVISGAVFLALAVFIFVYAQTLPPMPGQRYGAGAFPTVIALGLGGFSLLMMVQAWRRRTLGSPWIELPAWARDGRMVLNFALGIAIILAYIFLSEPIGFIPISIAILMILFVVQGVSMLTSAIVAVVTTLVTYEAFAIALRVPLPGGILTNVL